MPESKALTPYVWRFENSRLKDALVVPATSDTQVRTEMPDNWEYDTRFVSAFAAESEHTAVMCAECEYLAAVEDYLCEECRHGG